MSDLLYENIRRTIGQDVPQKDLADFRELFSEKSLDKKVVLSEEGKPCKYTWFLLRGAAYSYHLNEEMEKTVIQFAIEGYWITDMYSFFTGQNALFTIETLEPTEALYFSHARFEEACQRFPFAERFFRILAQNATTALLYRIAKTNGDPAVNRYLEFAEKYPHFLQRIPQYLIASYLGIAPQSLSRIRQQLASSGR